MSFKFFKNGKEISAPRRISWRFEGHSQVFESAPDKLYVNAAFWKRKLDLPADTEVRLIEKDYELETYNTKIKTDDTTHGFSTHNSSDSTSNHGTALESPVPEALEDTVDSTKRKHKRKADELPDVSSLLADSADAVND